MGILDQHISEDDLRAHEYLYTEAWKLNNITNKITFDYASCLVQCDNAVDVHRGISLLKKLVESNPKVLDYYYYLALGYAHVNDFEQSMSFLHEILHQDSFHRQAMDLKKEISVKVHSMAKAKELENLTKGAVVAGGFVAVAGGLAALAYGLSRKKPKE